MLSIGPKLDAFEKAIATYVGARHAIGVNSGTSGLHLCVIAAGITEGDLVITTPFSFIASSNCILYERAIPVYVDVDLTTGNIDPTLVTQAVDNLMRKQKKKGTNGHLKAILPVHAFGQPADMDSDYGSRPAA